MLPDDQATKLRRLIDKHKESHYVLFDEVEELLSSTHNGGKKLEDVILAIENAGIEIFDEPKADFEARFAGISPSTELTFGDGDPVKVYVHEACQRPRLSRAREIELAELMLLDDPRTAEEARTELAEGNLKVVVAISQRHAGQGVRILDLIYAGYEGLLSAIQRFDCRRGYRFSSYAIWWIRQAIVRAARVH